MSEQSSHVFYPIGFTPVHTIKRNGVYEHKGGRNDTLVFRPDGPMTVMTDGLDLYQMRKTEKPTERRWLRISQNGDVEMCSIKREWAYIEQWDWESASCPK